MLPLLRNRQIGEGVKLAATYLWRGRDVIGHEDPGFVRSRCEIRPSYNLLRNYRARR